jgi:alpha-1,2-mannosyltransferase
VFTPHGPDLYGTEPASFYLMNGLLNFNLVFPLALAVVPVQALARRLLQPEGASEPSIFLPDWLSQAPLHLWLLVFWTRPHKEERFLFPVYPLICLAGAMVIDSGQKIFYFLFVRVKSRHFLAHTRWLGLLAVGLSAVLSLSRMAALYQGYHGVTDTWMAVNQLPDLASSQTTVCVGKEWHRFPSSFFLPTSNFRIAFLQSEFRGQLPKYYPKPTRPGQLSTQVSSPDFNDQNLEEASRYIANPAECHYLGKLPLSSSLPVPCSRSGG